MIIGPDLIVRDGEVQTLPEKRSKMDKSLHGYKKEFEENPEGARAKADAIIRNTYRTLMTRGMKGCYIFCTDAQTAAHFRGRLAKQSGDVSLRKVAEESGQY